jgi:hypothetical protein
MAAVEPEFDLQAEMDLVRDFTWPELLEYNISFLKGESQGTFYHHGPLLSDQVPEDLIALHKRDIFTEDGQGTQTTRGFTPQGFRNTKSVLECLSSTFDRSTGVMRSAT